MDNKDRSYYLLALKIVGDFGLSIAAPVVILVLIGEYIDGRFDTAPWFTVSAFFFAALISGLIVYKKNKNIRSRIPKVKRFKIIWLHIFQL
jgi:F0F1-type ATP synthase assembly protein I